MISPSKLNSAFKLFSLVIALLASQIANGESLLKGKAKIALVIDDIGYNKPLGLRATELPGAITYAVIPHTPLAKKLAFYALHKNPDKEVIVHMPMQSSLGKELGSGGLTDDLDKPQFIARVRDALKEVPFAQGLSNHMGSHLTALPEQMQWLMNELNQQDFYYLDSKTSPSDHPQRAAEKSEVPYLQRDIFLDHDPSPEAIKNAFQNAIELAKSRGYAVVLAHPYRSSLNYLERTLPTLDEQNIELTTLGKLLELERENLLLASRSNH